MERQRVLKVTPEYKLTARKRLIKKLYGISYEEAQHIFESQGRVCACCKSPDPRGGRGWCIEHCHATGTIRGIVCSACNNGVARFDDSIEKLQLAIAYLERNGRDVELALRSMPPVLKPGARVQVGNVQGTVLSISNRLDRSGRKNRRAKVLWDGLTAADYVLAESLTLIGEVELNIKSSEINGVYRGEMPQTLVINASRERAA